MKRRDLLQGLAAVVPASAVLGHYTALAAPLRKKVKITDLKVMVVGKPGGNTLVRIDTDAGVSGYGEAYWGFGIKDVMLGYLRDTVMGQDPLDIDPLYTQMILRTGGAGAIGGVTITAISGVEIALWDLAGKLLGVPVCKLLGGQYRSGVRAYLTTSPADFLDPASCREWAAMVKEHRYGFEAVKTDIRRAGDPYGLVPGDARFNSRQLSLHDLEINAKGFANVREALGDRFEIAVHCHWELDMSDALNLARAVAPIQPMWLEDPMDPDFSESWVKLTEESPVPILTGENLYTRRGFMPFIVHQGCKIVQIDIPKSGGLLESKKIADLADIFSIPVSAHNAIGPLGAIASAHCAAAIRDFKAHELALSPSLGPAASKTHELPWGFYQGDPSLTWEKFVLHDGPLVKDGRIQVPDKPGLGVEPNPDYVRAHLAPGEVWWG
jgi:L-alanine-DL-glutamate epimerase-like enolase superfamily enzyme